MTVLPVPPFGPSTQIIAPLPEPLAARRRAPARDDLLEREPNALGRLGQAHDVVGSHLEEPAQEAVGRRLREDDDRQLRVLARRAADQRERALGVAGARDHEQIGRRLLQRRPALLDAAEEADDLDRGIVRQRRAHGGLVDAVVERDERPDGAARPRAYLAEDVAGGDDRPRRRLARPSADGGRTRSCRSRQRNANLSTPARRHTKDVVRRTSARPCSSRPGSAPRGRARSACSRP